MNYQAPIAQQMSTLQEKLKKASQSYASARSSLLLVVILSAVNVAMIASNADSYFLFSATLPLYFTYVGLVPVAIAMIVPYLLSWLFSKKRVGWLVAALVFFIIDTIGIFVFFYVSEMILDLILHVVVIVLLISGIANAGKIKKLSAEYAQLVPQYEAYVAEQQAAAAAAQQVPVVETPAQEAVEAPVVEAPAADETQGTL